MPTQVQFRRGTTAQNDNFLGAEGELSVNTSNNTIRVHDGITVGGFELAKQGNSDTIVEGVTNLYFTTVRSNTSIDNRVTKSFIDNLGVDATTLDGIDSSAFALDTDLTTANVAELTNLYFTEARVNTAVASNLSLKANVVDLTTANVAELTNLYFTNARARLAVSQGSGVSYNNSTGVISANVTSVAGRTGAVVLTNADISGLTTANVAEVTNQYFTNARARLAVSQGSGVSYNNSTGVISANVTSVNGSTGAVTGLATTAANLSQFASTTSAQLASILSDETGTGSIVLSTSATLVTPILGTPQSGTLTNATGLPIDAGTTGTLPVARGGTGETTSTGTGAVVLATSPTLVTPVLGTPSSATLTNATGLPISTGVAGLASGVATFLGNPTSANLAAAITNETGSGALVFATSPTLVTPVLGTPSSGTLTNATGLPISTGVAGLASGVATFLGNPTSANLIATVTDETGSGALVFATSPTLVTPVLGTPSSANLISAVGLPINVGTTGTLPVARGGTGATTSTGTGITVLSESPTFTGTAVFDSLSASGNLIITGNLTVNGTTTTINSTTLTVDDKNIELGAITTPSDVTADGGGITLKGTTDKTFNYIDSTTAWTSNQDLNLLTGKIFKINGTSVLSSTTLGTGVIGSSLTSVGTITTGVWNGSSISTTFTDAKVTSVNGQTGAVTGFATTANSLSQFASTTSSQLATLISDETGSGSLVFATSPTLVTPILGTPQSGTLTNATGLPIVAGTTGTLSVARGGTGVTTSTGTGNVVLSTSPVLTTPNLGTPSAVVLTSGTGLPISTGVSGLGTGIATFLATPSSSNLAAAVTDETGSGSLVFATSPTLITPALGTPASGNLINTTSLPIVAGTTGTLSVARGGTGETTSTGTGAVVLASRLTTANVAEVTNLYFTNARAVSAVTGNLALKANVADLTTANVSELTNQYFTNARARLAVSQGSGVSYNNSTGVISANVTSVAGRTGAVVLTNADISGLTTANVSELTNQYFTNARARLAVSQGSGISYNNSTGVISANITSVAGRTGAVVLTNADISGLTTANVTEVTNLYFTNARAVSAVTGNLALKANVADLTTANVSELTNQYFTNARARLSVSQGSGVSYNNSTGVISANVTSVNGSTGAVTGLAVTSSNLSQFASTTSAQLASLISNETGSGSLVFATSPTLVTPILGTPQSGTLTNVTGLPIVAGTTGTLSVARGGTGVTTSTGTGAVVLSISPTFTGTVNAANIDATGTITSPFFFSESDIVLKEEINPIKDPLKKLLKLVGVDFIWKSSKQKAIGVIAQDVEKILPEIVGKSNSGFKTVQYDSLIPLLIEAIKEQQKQIDDLRKKIK